MTAPSFNGCFPHGWTAEILPQRPMILPARHYVYPAMVEEVERGALEVLIQTRAQAGAGEQPYLATCALGFRDPATPTGLWAMPDADWLCAVSGGYAYLINTAEPERFVHLRYRPVLQVVCVTEEELSQAGGLLLFIGHHSILAWGAAGEAWESQRLSAEGITVEGVEDGVLKGVGWDMRTDRDLPFALDLKTGLVLS